MAEIVRTCKKCGAVIDGDLRSGPFGFRVHDCKWCRTRTWFPLKKSTRITFTVLFCVAATLLLLALGTGNVVIPGALFVFPGIVLLIDARLRRASGTSASMAAVMSGVLVLSGLSWGVFEGLDNAYTTTVRIAEAEEIRPYVNYDLIGSADRLCTAGDDYSTCVSMHVAMYNSVCVPTATPSWAVDRRSSDAIGVCADLDAFINSSKETLAGCGYNCVTGGQPGDPWGWSYLRIAVRATPVDTAAIDTEKECWFALGSIELGYCPK